MSFYDSLKEKLKNKNLTESSINLYIRNLEKLNDKEPFKNFNFLKNMEDINKKLDKYKDNTKRSYYISIVSCLSTEPKFKKLYDKYYIQMMDINKIIKSKPTEIMSEVQKNNWLEWDEVEKIKNNLYESYNKLPKKIKTEKQFNILLDYLVLSLYTDGIAPRRNKDYLDMHISKNMDMNDKDKNYYDVDSKEFIFNNYKTSKIKGQQIIKVPENLVKVLEYYINNHPLITKKDKKYEVPLLVNFDGSYINNINSITYILNKIFGRKIGSSMLRHIYLSSKFGNINKEMKETADEMGHSTITQKEYIKDITV